MKNVGIIGCGMISHFHHEGFAKAGAKVAVVCDLRREAAEAVAARYGAKATTDWREVVADRGVDLVSVLTPARTHREICLAAIAAGKGVVCEKTLADGGAAAFEIAQAAATKKSFFTTAFMKRFFPAARQAKALLAGMGPVTSLHARTWQPFADLWHDPIPEGFLGTPSHFTRNYGGGILVCGGSHILDLIHWFGGRPTQLCAHQWTRPVLDFDLRANAMLWLPEGGIAHLEAAWHPFSRVGFERNGWDERLEINTPRGRLDLSTVMWNEPEKNGALLIHQDAASGKVTEYRYAAENAFHLEMAEALRRFEAGEPGDPSAIDGYVVDELLETLGASARQNAVLPLRWKDR
jgi:predicted dehydrogenase